MTAGIGYQAGEADSQAGLCTLMRQLVFQARVSQANWSMVSVNQRLPLIRRFRELLAEQAPSLCKLASRIEDRPPSEILTAEIFPLIAACRFLEREAPALLAARRLGRSGRPFWLRGVAAEVYRDPYGVILIIAPVNYSFALPGIQLLHALVSGNAVLLKPGLRGTHSARALLQLLGAAGCGDGLVTLLPESVEAAKAALSAGIDKVLFTGTASVGAEILGDLAPQIVPATMELSGCDAMWVREDADLQLVKKSLQYSLQLNSGATCIAPHRLLVAESRADELEGLIYEHFKKQPRWKLTPPVASRFLPALKEALAGGADFLSGGIEPDGSIIAPLILRGAPPDCRLWREAIFGPMVATLRVKDDEESIRTINDCPYALGASIFSANEVLARSVAIRLRVGFITVNDVIVPAGDPRIPISGRGRSGFGATRGREGLLDLTVPKVVALRRGRFRPHLAALTEEDAELLYGYLKLTNAGNLQCRASALAFLARRLFTRNPVCPQP